VNELTKKNFLAMSEGLKALRSEISELKIEKREQDEQIGQLRTELNSMKSKQGIMMAKLHGTGATVGV